MEKLNEPIDFLKLNLSEEDKEIFKKINELSTLVKERKGKEEEFAIAFFAAAKEQDQAKGFAATFVCGMPGILCLVFKKAIKKHPELLDVLNSVQMDHLAEQILSGLATPRNKTPI